MWPTDRTVIGPKPHYTFTADAVTRSALSPMFSGGRRLLYTRTPENPACRPPGTDRTYPALVVAATRHSGVVHLVVVNRLPQRAVSASIRLEGRATLGQATIRSVTGPSFRSRNMPDEPPAVVLRESTRQIGPGGFRYVFPAASTTVFRIPLRR